MHSKLKPVGPVGLVGHSKQDQIMSIDIMYVCEIAFMVTLVSRLNLLMTMRIDSRSVPHLVWKKIYGQIANLKKKGFQITRVEVDPESRLACMSNLFANESIELATTCS